MNRSERLAGERVGAILLVALGLAGLYIASGLTFGTIHQPGTGFYPTLVCLLLVACGGLSFASPGSPVLEDDASQPQANTRVWMVVTVLALYAWALPGIGFVLCTVVLLLVLLRGIGKLSWVASVAISIIGSISTYEVFVKLGLPLPPGPLPF